MHPRCANLTEQLNSLGWKENGDEFAGADHAVDALRYALKNFHYGDPEGMEVAGMRK